MNIVVYGLPTCPKCDEVKKYLESENLSYKYSEVGKDILREELELVVSRVIRSVPVVTLNGREVALEELKKEVGEFKQRVEDVSSIDNSIQRAKITAESLFDIDIKL